MPGATQDIKAEAILQETKKEVKADKTKSPQSVLASKLAGLTKDLHPSLASQTLLTDFENSLYEELTKVLLEDCWAALVHIPPGTERLPTPPGLWQEVGGEICQRCRFQRGCQVLVGTGPPAARRHLRSVRRPPVTEDTLPWWQRKKFESPINILDSQRQV